MKFIFYIDGDNAPKQSIEGIMELDKDDCVYIFYASNNAHYCKQETRNDLQTRCDCKVRFRHVKAGANAVDFAVAMMAGAEWADGPHQDVLLFLISRDNHFEIIRQQLAETYKLGGSVHLGQSIQEIYDKYFWVKMKLEDDLKLMLEEMVGEWNVQSVIHQLKEVLTPPEFNELESPVAPTLTAEQILQQLSEPETAPDWVPNFLLGNMTKR